jgi:ABC-type nickel/cobalt efflux system permease component RcnA
MNRRTLWKATAVGIVGLAIGAVVGVEPAAAHPLGNFTVNQYAGVRVAAGEVRVDYVVDMAELPTFQAKSSSELDADGNGKIAANERDAYAAKACGQVLADTRVDAAGETVKLAVDGTRLSFPAGQGGLETLRLECGLRGPAAVDGETKVSYHGGSYADRIGWREVTAVGDGTTLRRSDVPAKSPSQRLTKYPSDLLSSPPDVRAATLTVVPGGARAVSDVGPGSEPAGPLLASGRGVDTLTRAFTDLVGRPQLTLAFGILAVLISIVLGAAHAVAPGHGKTVMAAFLVGERGSFKQAGMVALTVTVTHTAGVLVLGILLSTSVVLAPERLYAWLGLLSGALLAGVGWTLLRRAWRARPAAAAVHIHEPELVHAHAGGPSPEHSQAPEHPAGQPHSHEHDHDHGHSHGPGHHHHHDIPGTLSVRSLIAMGFAGGLVPSPSALVVLLGAVALGRTWFGVLLVLGYGLGMACTLTGVGFALARWRSVIERRTAGRFAGKLRRLVPLATASLIVLVGLGLASQAAIALGTS